MTSFKQLFAILADSTDNLVTTIRLRNQIFLVNDLEVLVSNSEGKSFCSYDRKADEVNFLTKDEVLSLRDERHLTLCALGKSFKKEDATFEGDNFFLTELAR